MRPRAITALLASAALAVGVLVTAPTASANQAPRPFVSGWFGWWASDTAITQMTSGSDGVVGEVAMFWWSFQGDKTPLCIYDNGDYNKNGVWGDAWCNSPTPWTTPKFDRQRKALQAAGIKVNASITDLGASSKGKLSAYLATAKNRRAYAKLITDYAVKAGVDGIDLDWEVFAFHDGRDSWKATKPRWVAMIKELSKQLRAKGLTLWATVPGGSSPFVASWMSPTNECGDPRGSTGAPNPGTNYCVYAWSEIAPFVDRLKIMAYDYSFSVPGPIGPNNWASQVSQSAVQQVGADQASKVWIGVPQYGRNWPVRSGNNWAVDPECPSGWRPNTAPARTTVTPAAARTLASREKVKPAWNATHGEWSFEYWLATAGKVGGKAQECKVKRSVWFADTDSALARAKIVPDQRIGGIAVWDFGTVTSDFFPRLAEYGRDIAPAATTVTVRAPKAAVPGSTIAVRVATRSRDGGAGGAQATLYFTPQGGAATRARVDTITLDSEGTGVFRVPVTVSGAWSVAVAGSWSRGEGESATVSTAVRFGIEAKASASRVPVGTPVTITGTVTPKSAGTTVQVQRRSGSGAWRDISTLTTAADGSVSATVRPTVKGEVSFRLVVPAAGGLAQAASARIVITVN
jgi:spore germination protein YaaH